MHSTLHERIATALGWTVEQTRSFSLLALRDLVRPVSAKLANEITGLLADPDGEEARVRKLHTNRRIHGAWAGWRP